jgi:hypothetical protein
MNPRPFSDEIRALLETVEGSSGKDIVPVSTAMRAEARRKEEQKEEARQAKIAAELNDEKDPDHLISEMIGDQGIYVGRYVLFQGGSLHKTFNIFAAPQDLTDDTGRESTYAYDEAVQLVAGLKNWHGHDGADYKDAEQLHDALKAGTYGGGWIVPPCSMLCEVSNHKDEGELKGSFMKASSDSSPLSYPEVYWTSNIRKVDGAINVLNFRSGGGSYNRPDAGRSFSCRPVRLVPVGKL